MKFKTSKSALTILLGTTILCGCVNDPNIKNERHYYDDNGNRITKEEVAANKEKLSKDDTVIRAFETTARTLERTRNNLPLENFKAECYEQTIKYGDFLLEGKQVAGVSLDELTDEGKQTIVDMSMAADSKIIEYFPEYKEYISTKVAAIKETIKDVTIDVIGEENYVKFGIKKNEIVADAKNVYLRAKEKVITEFEDFKNNHKAK